MKDIQNLYYIMGFNEADEEVGVWLESLLFVFAAATDIDASNTMKRRRVLDLRNIYYLHV